MRKDIIITAEPRSTRGKNEARRLRVTQKIPAVVYGSGRQSVAVSVSPKDVNKILHSGTGHNTIFNVDIAGEENSPVMIVDWQRDPVKGSLLHVDLERIDLRKRLRVKVPVHPAGDPVGVKQQGGLHDIVHREIEIECLPDEIPEKFEADVRHLHIGQSLRAGEIALAGTMKLLSHADMVISHVVPLRGTAEAEAPAEGAAAAAAAPAEPEVIKKGKKEEEGAETKKK